MGPQKNASVKEVIKLMREKDEIVQPCTVSSKGFVTDDIYKKAKEVIDAEKYVDDFLHTYGTKAMLSLRIRRGYIGKEIDLGNGVKGLQTQRSRPFGTMVAIRDEVTQNVSYGVSYVSPTEEKHYRIVGLALALKRAQGVEETVTVKKIDADLFNYFTIRSRAYFFPEKYSRKHNAEHPIEYPNYEKIHRNRRLLGYY